MKKQITKLLSLLTVFVLLMTVLVSTGITASAAYVVDNGELVTAGDVNSDGSIDILDLVGAQLAHGSTGESSNWSAAADLDGTGDIGNYDLALIRAMILGIDKSQWTE